MKKEGRIAKHLIKILLVLSQTNFSNLLLTEKMYKITIKIIWAKQSKANT